MSAQLAAASAADSILERVTSKCESESRRVSHVAVDVGDDEWRIDGCTDRQLQMLMNAFWFEINNVLVTPD